MFTKKHGGISALIICLILISPLISRAQNLGAFDPNDVVDFDILKVSRGDVFDIQVADVDRDHIDDIIYVGMMDTDLHIMYGNKGGGFESPISYSSGGRTIATAYINKDKYLDIICSYMYDVFIFINNGDRTFTISSISHEYTTVGGIATGYFNDDSYLDIIAAYRFIYYGDGDGNFPIIDTLPSKFQTVYVSDFNNDKIDDFITITNNGVSTIYINKQNGNFEPKGSFSLGGLALGVSIKKPFADFNHDGNADFAFIADIGNFQSKITVGFGDGAGGISNFDYIILPGVAYSLAIADTDRDKNLDLIASNISFSRMELFLGNNEGEFSDPYYFNFQTSSIVKALATGDLDRDGNPDFAAGAYWNNEFISDSIILLINLGEDTQVLEEPMITTGFSNVSIDIINPPGFELSQNYKTVAGAVYWRQDVDLDNTIDEWAIDYNLQYGEYKIIIKPKANASSGSTFSATINIGSEEMTLFKDYKIPDNTKGAEDSIVFYYTVEEFSSIQPVNGSTVDTDKPLFDWSGLVNHVPGVSSYHFEVSPDYYFVSPDAKEADIDLPQYRPDVPMVGNSVYYWRFRSFDGAEWSDYSRTFAVVCKSPTDIGDDESRRRLPDSPILAQNYPNPFNPSTEIYFSLPRASQARLEIYNIIGNKVATLVDRFLNAGEHRVVWNGECADGAKAASGFYFYRLSTDNFSESRKMLLLK